MDTKPLAGPAEEPPLPPAVEAELRQALLLAQAEVDRLNAEYDDLKLLYEAMIEHGEAVEDQLDQNNRLLQQMQARLEEEIEDAERYVFSILPDERAAHPRTRWAFAPSTELGGDSFGYHEIDADHIAFYLLDVCGHGVGAAFLSISAINVLRASALPACDFREPGTVLAALNRTFPMERQNNRFFTIWYGVYRRSTETLRFASAGHPPAIHLRGGNGADGPEVRELSTPEGIAIGVVDDMDYPTETIRVEPGDRLLILSDGTFELFDKAGNMTALEDLVAFVRGEAGGDDPQRVLAWSRSIGGEKTLPDDFSLLRVEF